MVKYEAIEEAIFLSRPNRFIAICQTQTGEEVTVHVKNTGRCKELLIPGVTVAINHQPFPHRKTAYDLIAVKKKETWFNIDSQVPNQLVEDGLRETIILLPQVKGSLTNIQREYTFGESRFDIYAETNLGEKILLEVKGMTLEEENIGYFPDAPSVRALKHVQTLQQAKQEGFLIGVVFVVQFSPIRFATINQPMQPQLYQAFQEGLANDMMVLAIDCLVTPSTIELHKEVPFRLT